MPGEAPATCPKCGAARTDADACPACGLAAEHVADYAARLDDEVPDTVRHAWAKLRDQWDQPAAHEEFLGLVAVHRSFHWAARQYRQARGDDGDPIADRGLQRMRRAAEASLLTSAGPRADGKLPYRSSLLVLLLLVILMGVGLLYVKVRSSTSSRPPAPNTRPARMGPTRAPAPPAPGSPASRPPPAPTQMR